jgi:tRNA 5-methylaminomethyl-2-thiouridine biosynthesis bifunctional protein
MRQLWYGSFSISDVVCNLLAPDMAAQARIIAGRDAIGLRFAQTASAFACRRQAVHEIHVKHERKTKIDRAANRFIAARSFFVAFVFFVDKTKRRTRLATMRHLPSIAAFMPVHRLVPATLAYAHGVPFSSTFDDVYHSADGGLAQARHVFLGGNGLPQRWRAQRRFVILETGFGLGLNFLATWAAWRDDAARPAQLHYVAVEKHPFCTADLAQLHAQWPELASLSAELLAAWPPLVPGFHRLLLDGGNVVLTLVFGDITDCLPQIDAAADAFYLDGFAPPKNPDMWSPAVLIRLGRLAAPHATLATWSISAAVRKALAQAGFICERLPGFGRKPEMLGGRFAPRWQPPLRHTAGAREAIVIGAGIAGSAACERLAARGWQLTLIERHAQPAQEASGNLAGIVMPLLSRDDNLPSRLARAAYLFTLQWWRQVGGIGNAFAGEACGVLQLATDATQASMQRAVIDECGYPPEFARWLDAAAVAHMTGNDAAHGGWLFPQGGWVTPASLCDALLHACGERLQRRFAHDAASVQRIGERWQVRDAAGAVIAEAPVLIVANGTNATLLPQTQDLPLSAIRGQVSHLPASALPAIPLVLCGDGYLTRPVHGMCCVGASYDFDDDPLLRQDSHDANLARLAQILPQAGGVDAMPLVGRVGFRCAAPDRLPLAGALPDSTARIAGSRLRDVARLPDMYGLLGYGSRGLIWAAFCAELLASQLEGEPLPVESMLAAALDPARFALKSHRRGTNLTLNEPD